MGKPKPKWMPGPYRVMEPQGNLPLSIVADDEIGFWEIATVADGCGDPDTAEHNARLLAAAPELYEMCDRFCELFCLADMTPEDETHDLYDRMQIVMAKARGETQP